MLPLTFADPADYDRIAPDAKVDLLCTELAVEKPMTLRVHPKDGASFDVKLAHTFNDMALPSTPWPASLVTKRLL